MSELKPLYGHGVLNTRPAHQAMKDSKRLREAGATVIDYPVLAIETLPMTQLDSTPPAIIIFCSSNAVDSFFNQHQNLAQDWPKNVIWMAIGHATAFAINRYMSVSVLYPLEEDSEHLLSMPELKDVFLKKILIAKGQGGRDLLEQTLRSRGANVDILTLYRRILCRQNDSLIQQLWQHREVDIILVTSETGFRHLFSQFPKEAYPWLMSLLWVVPSNRLYEIARGFSLQHILVASGSGWVDALIEYHTGTAP